jgi:CDP-paratose 2-epimerase
VPSNCSLLGNWPNPNRSALVVPKMRLLITGVCGFVGSCVAKTLRAWHPDWTVCGLDNFSRPGSRRNQPTLEKQGIQVFEADLRNRDFSSHIPKCDWVIDCAANPSVLAGLSSTSPSLEVMDHNLIGTLHLLEYCKTHSSGLVLVSTSRVYSATRLSQLPVSVIDDAYVPDWTTLRQAASSESAWFGLSEQGVNENFSDSPPLSLYGVSKRTSELISMEYASAFDFPLFINRCGVMAGAGQFGKPDQGIVAFWIHSWFEGRPLAYIGFDGQGHQVRDCLHPEDLARLLDIQISSSQSFTGPRLCNVSGGIDSAFSLRQLSAWCERRWPAREDQLSNPVRSIFDARPYDAPWIVLDSSLAKATWQWEPKRTNESIWDEIARHAQEQPNWLEACSR